MRVMEARALVPAARDLIYECARRKAHGEGAELGAYWLMDSRCLEVLFKCSFRI